MEKLAIALAALGLAAYAIACYLSAENLAATWWDEWVLSRCDLRALDAMCAANTRSSGLIVSLTTIPSRIGATAPALKSLLRQTARPEEIRVCVPTWSGREGRAYDVPSWLIGLSCVRVVRCEDHGPATKFIPTLRSVAADKVVVVLDDDRAYHARLLETFAGLTREHPDQVVAAAGWTAPADLVDRQTTLMGRLSGAPQVPVRANQLRNPRRVDVVQGVHAYAVRPRFFDLEALADFAGAPAAVRFVDDVWLSAHARVPRVVHPMRLPFTDYMPWLQRGTFRRTSLGANVNRAADPACRGNSVALRHFRDRWARSDRRHADQD